MIPSPSALPLASSPGTREDPRPRSRPPSTPSPPLPYPTRSLSLGSRPPGYPIRDGNHVLEAYEEYVAPPRRCGPCPAGRFPSQHCVLPRSAPATARPRQTSLTAFPRPHRTQRNPSGPASQHILPLTLDIDDNGQGGQDPVRSSHPHRREQHTYVRPTRQPRHRPAHRRPALPRPSTSRPR